MATGDSAMRTANFFFNGDEKEDFAAYYNSTKSFMAMKFGLVVAKFFNGTASASRCASESPEQNFFLRALLGYTCKKTALQLIENVPMEDGMVALELLITNFSKKGEKYMPGILHQFQGLKFDSPIQLRHDTNKLIRDMKDCGYTLSRESKEIPEVVIKIMVLATLPEIYGQFYFSAIEKSDQPLNVMLDELTSFHKSVEVRQSAAHDDVPAMSFTADRGRGRGNGRGRGSGRGNSRGGGRGGAYGGGNGGGNGAGGDTPKTKCPHCHEGYHVAEKCYTKFPHLRPPGWKPKAKAVEGAHMAVVDGDGMSPDAFELDVLSLELNGVSLKALCTVIGDEPFELEAVADVPFVCEDVPKIIEQTVIDHISVGENVNPTALDEVSPSMPKHSQPSALNADFHVEPMGVYHTSSPPNTHEDILSKEQSVSLSESGTLSHQGHTVDRPESMHMSQSYAEGCGGASATESTFILNPLSDDGTLSHRKSHFGYPGSDHVGCDDAPMTEFILNRDRTMASPNPTPMPLQSCSGGRCTVLLATSPGETTTKSMTMSMSSGETAVDGMHNAGAMTNYGTGIGPMHVHAPVAIAPDTMSEGVGAHYNVALTTDGMHNAGAMTNYDTGIDPMQVHAPVAIAPDTMSEGVGAHYNVELTTAGSPIEADTTWWDDSTRVEIPQPDGRSYNVYNSQGEFLYEVLHPLDHRVLDARADYYMHHVLLHQPNTWPTYAEWLREREELRAVLRQPFGPYWTGYDPEGKGYDPTASQDGLPLLVEGGDGLDTLLTRDLHANVVYNISADAELALATTSTQHNNPAADTGAAVHLSYNQHDFEDLVLFENGDAPTVRAASGTQLTVAGKGTLVYYVMVVLPDGSQRVSKWSLKNALWVPTLKIPLISITTLTYINRDKSKPTGHEFILGGQQSRFLLKNQSHIPVYLHKENNLPYFHVLPKPAPMPVDGALVMTATKETSASEAKLLDLHARMAHANGRAVARLFSLPQQDVTCIACDVSKITRQPHDYDNSVSGVATYPGQIIAADMAGPMTPSLGKMLYLLLVVDAFSKYSKTMFTKTKKEPSPLFEKAKQHFETLSATTPIILQPGTIVFTDNQFLSGPMTVWTAKYGFVQQASPPHTPQLNPIPESAIRILRIRTITLLYIADLPAEFWCLAWAHAEALQNHLPMSHAPYNIPIEVFTNSKLTEHKIQQLAAMPIFGSTAVVHNATPGPKGDFQPKGILRVMVGFNFTNNSYVVYDKTTNRISNTVHVKFHDPVFPREVPRGLSTTPSTAIELDVLLFGDAMLPLPLVSTPVTVSAAPPCAAPPAVTVGAPSIPVMRGFESIARIYSNSE
jgi:hypothetical protein